MYDIGAHLAVLLSPMMNVQTARIPIQQLAQPGNAQLGDLILGLVDNADLPQHMLHAMHGCWL